MSRRTRPGFPYLAGAPLLIAHRGGSRLASRLGVPPIVIGLTIVAVGTSTPELAIGVEAALRWLGEQMQHNFAVDGRLEDGATRLKFIAKESGIGEIAIMSDGNAPALTTT